MLNTLLRQRNSLQRQHNQLTKQLQLLKEQLTQVEGQIKDTCQHQWEVDNESDYGPYGKPDKICQICHTVKYGGT